MTLDGLRALLAVIDTGSINQAAALLGVPRTTLTRRLDALEAWFDAPLLTTSRDGAAPTEAGAQLAAGAEALLRDAATLDASVRMGLQTPTRPVRLSISPGFHPTQLAMGLRHLRQRLPGVQLRIRAQADPFGRDPDGPPDFILSFGRPVRGEFRTFQLVKLRFALRASPAYLERFGAPASPEELRSHALWAWEGALLRSEAGAAVQLADGSRLPVTPAVVLNDIHQLHVVMQHGLCLALVPCSPFDAFEPDEVEVLEGALGGSTGLWVAVPERIVDLPWTRRLLEELRGVFALFDEVDAGSPASPVQGIVQT